MQFNRTINEGDAKIQDIIELADLGAARRLMNDIFFDSDIADLTFSSEEQEFESGARWFTIRGKDNRILWQIRYSRAPRPAEKA